MFKATVTIEDDKGEDVHEEIVYGWTEERCSSRAGALRNKLEAQYGDGSNGIIAASEEIDLRDMINEGAYETKLPYESYRGDPVANLAYTQDRQRLEREFQGDALVEVGLDQWPTEVTDAIYAKAWADGHSSGYTEVLGILEELADLAKLIAAKAPVAA